MIASHDLWVSGLSIATTAVALFTLAEWLEHRGHQHPHKVIALRGSLTVAACMALILAVETGFPTAVIAWTKEAKQGVQAAVATPLPGNPHKHHSLHLSRPPTTTNLTPVPTSRPTTAHRWRRRS